MINYKGLFYKDETKKKYYEGGAHFRYKDLFSELEALKYKKDEEENIKNNHSINKSIDYLKDSEKIKLNNQKTNLYTFDKQDNIFESPKKGKKTNIDIIDKILSLDRSKIHKKNKLQLLEIKSDNNQKKLPFNTDNNRYNDNDIRPRNNSLDFKFLLNEKNKYKNNVLLTEERYSNKNDNLIIKRKLAESLNPKSYKTLSNVTDLPKIESPYFNRFSNKNIFKNYNLISNILTNSINKRDEINDQK